MDDDWLEKAAKATGVDLSRMKTGPALTKDEIHKLLDWEQAHTTQDTYYATVGEWSLVLDLSITEAGLICRQLTIRPQHGLTPRDGVGSRLLHSIKLGEILQEAADHYRLAGKRSTGRPRAIPSVRSRRGQWAWGDEHYQMVAFAYLFALREAPRRPRALMERWWAKQGYRPSQIRDWIREARLRGYLTEAEPGKPGALPGPNMPPAMVEAWKADELRAESKPRKGRGKR